MSYRINTALLLLALAGTVRADDWPQWRGPNLDGLSTEKNLPTKFSAKTNVVWAAKMPGMGGSTPAIWKRQDLRDQ